MLKLSRYSGQDSTVIELITLKIQIKSAGQTCGLTMICIYNIICSELGHSVLCTQGNISTLDFAP